MRGYLSTDTKYLEAVFIAYRRGTLNDVKRKLSVLRGTHAQAVNGSLAFLALQERRPDVLKLCLDQGIAFEPIFHVEAENVDREIDPDTFNVLEQSEFRWLNPRDTSEEREQKLNSRDPAVVFDKGGKMPVEW